MDSMSTPTNAHQLLTADGAPPRALATRHASARAQHTGSRRQGGPSVGWSVPLVLVAPLDSTLLAAPRGSLIHPRQNDRTIDTTKFSQHKTHLFRNTRRTQPSMQTTTADMKVDDENKIDEGLYS